MVGFWNISIAKCYLSCSQLGLSWLEVGHLVGAHWDNSELVVHNLAVSECQSLTDLSDHCLHVEGLAWQSGARIVLGNVQRNPLASLFLIKSENCQRSGQVCPSSKCTTMNTADVSSIAMEFSGIVILKYNMTNVRVELVLNLLGDFVPINLENVLWVGDFNDGVWVELALKGLRVVSLIDLLDLKKSLLDVVDVVFALVWSGHFEMIDSVVQGVHWVNI